MNVSLPVIQNAARHVERKPALPALTGIRSLAAICIMLFHFTPAGLRWNAHPWVTLYPVVDLGFVFVGLFFLLSGFILTYNYADRPWMNAIDFWAARFSRLYPIYLLTLVISFPMIMVEFHVRSHAQFLEGMTLTPLLLQGLDPRLAIFANTVAWALSCELVFYLLFPWLNRLRWPSSTGKLLILFVALWLFGLTLSALYIHFDPDHLGRMPDRYSGGFWITTLKYTPLPYVSTFLAGITLGRLHHIANLGLRWRTIIGLCGFGGFIVLVWGYSAELPYIVLHGGLLLPVFAAMTLGMAGPGVLARVFSLPPLMWVGGASYALYLMHFNVFILLHLHHVPERLGVTRFDPWISYVFIIALALAVTHWVEVPAQKAILGWWKKRRVTQ
jgi:peptidoglycan/LPS O-acetylase OafA/YrhL